jgi:ubiquinone/menaquinone biosynthesis C-methylase UbiE
LDSSRTKNWEKFTVEEYSREYKQKLYISIWSERFNGTNETQLNFPSDSFDVVLSLSSIERFGVENYARALKSLKETG